MHSPRRRGFVRPLLLITVATVAAVIFVAPLWWTLVWATWRTDAIFTFPPKLLPGPDLIRNATAVEASVGITRALINSVITTACTIVGATFLCTLAGYAFAKFRFRGRSVLFLLVMATLVVPSQITIVPLFVTMVELGWVDTYPGLILPGLVPALGVFFMRSSIQQTIPNELLEAGRVDGAGELRIFLTIVLPALRPAIAALAILLGASTWGSLFWPMVILRSPEMFTLPVAMASLFGTMAQPYDQLMVGSLLSVIPPLVLFLALQKYFVRSIAISGIK